MNTSNMKTVMVITSRPLIWCTVINALARGCGSLTVVISYSNDTTKHAFNIEIGNHLPSLVVAAGVPVQNVAQNNCGRLSFYMYCDVRTDWCRRAHHKA